MQAEYHYCRDGFVRSSVGLVSAVKESCRVSAGVALVACLSLEKMPTAFVREVLSKSGLVPVEKITDTFQARGVAFDNVNIWENAEAFSVSSDVEPALVLHWFQHVEGSWWS